MTEPVRAPQFHVLLIGIDLYDGEPRASLDGCVNDIDRIQRILIDRVKVPGGRIKRLVSPLAMTRPDTTVPSDVPTLANIRGAFDLLASDHVEEGDRVFIYYAGHGTQVPVEVGGKRFMREALVPKDRFDHAERRLLFDWELNGMLARIAARTSSVTFILDCCASAGVTRDPGKARAKPRFWVEKTPYQLPADRAGPDFDVPRGLAIGSVRAIQVATACFADELARESADDGGVAHGELTRALAAHLEHDRPQEELAELRWSAVWRSVVAGVLDSGGNQTPWLSGGLGRKLFGGPPVDGDVGISVIRRGDVYELGAGSMSGVSKGALVSIYDAKDQMFPPLAEDAEKRSGVLAVIEADRATALAAPLPGQAPFDVPVGARGRLVKPGERERLRVALSRPDAALAGVIKSDLLEVVGHGQPAGVTLIEKGGNWFVTDDAYGDGTDPDRPALVSFPTCRPGWATALLEHYHQFTAALRLAKRSQDLPAPRMTLLDCRNMPALTPDQIQNPTGILPNYPPGTKAPYELRAGGNGSDPAADRFCIVVENPSGRDLSVAVIAMQQSGQVDRIGMAMIPGVRLANAAPGAPDRAPSSHAFWGDEILGKPFTVWFGRAGVILDRLIVIATSNRSATFDHLLTARSFDEILNTLRTRTIGAGRDVRASAPPEVWTATVTAVLSRR